MSDPRTGNHRGEPLQRTEIAGLIPHSAKSIWQALAGLVAVVFASDRIDANPIIIAAVVALGVGITIAVNFIRWWRTTYRVGADDIRLETGLLSREARSVPYERIQDVSIAEPLLARLVGLVSVTFETGAGGKDEIQLAYVSRAEGERLRSVVRRQIAAPAVRGGEDEQHVAEEQPGEVLFAMDLPRLLHFGLFEFSLVILTVIGAALQQLEFLLPFDIWSTEFWDQQLSIGNETVRALGMGAQIIAIIFAVGSLLVIGVVSGIVRTVLRDYGFLLERTERGFRRRRGLLTRTDVVMPVHRVQAAVLGTGMVRRLLGWHSLTFISLANDANSASHDVAPFAQREEIAPIADAAGLALPAAGTRWHRQSFRPWLDRIVLGALLLVPAAAVTLYLGSPFWWVPTGALVVWIAANRLQWMRRAWAFEDGQLFVKRGILAPIITSAPAIKLQSVEITQGPLGRLRGYVALQFGLAGGKLSISGLMRDTADTIRAGVLDEISQVDFSRLNRPAPGR